MYSHSQLADKLSLCVDLKKKNETLSEFTVDDEGILLKSMETFVTNLNKHPSDCKLLWSDIVNGLKLEHHPEGGFYRRFYWTKEKSIIFYLLPSESVSSWHRLNGTSETFKWMSGASLFIPQIGKDCRWLREDLVGQYEDFVILKGQRTEGCFDCEEWGTWYGAYFKDGDYSFVTCECKPTFEFSKFELATEQDVNQFSVTNPTCIEIIGKLSPKVVNFITEVK